MVKVQTLCSLATGFILLITSQSGFAESHVFSNKDLRGIYATSFEGEVIGIGSIASIGRINPDGKGNIPRAVRVISVGGIPIPAGVFTCTYTVLPEGIGSAECSTDEPAPGFPNTETFDFVLEDKGRAFRFVGTTPGVVILGTAKRQ